MEENLETLDGNEAPKVATETLKIFSILSYIGNAFWGIVFLLASVAVFGYAEIFYEMGLDSARFEEVKLMIVLAFLFFIIIIILSSIGVYKMHVKLQRSGFIMYAITNGIWGGLLILGGSEQLSNTVIGIISVAFIIVFSVQMKKIHA